MLAWRLANLAAERDKPRQGDGAMPAVIAPDFGVAVLIPQIFSVLARNDRDVEHDAGMR